jgi:hypothetical protein
MKMHLLTGILLSFLCIAALTNAEQKPRGLASAGVTPHVRTYYLCA